MLVAEQGTVGLSGSVAVLDAPMDRMVLLTSPSNQRLESSFLEVGKNVSKLHVDPQRQRLFVLANGVQPRKRPGDELPSLTVIDGGGWRPDSAADPADGERIHLDPFVLARYTLDDPPSGIDVDPLGEYAVVATGGGVVENPNELLLVKLPPKDAKGPLDPDDPGISLQAKTIRSFGSQPKAISFTRRLTFPDKERRLLLVQTSQEVTLIDLEDPDMEITVRLSERSAGNPSSPAEVVYHDQQPLSGSKPGETYPVIAVRLAQESTVQLISFGPGSEEVDEQEAGVSTKKVSFVVTVNLAEVEQVPTDIDFFWTEVAGTPKLRLAAMLPQGKRAALVDPETIQTDFIDLPASYAQMTRITDETASEEVSSDTALLWGATEPSVAFWQLGRTGSDAHHSLETRSVGVVVTSVLDIPRDDSGPVAEDFGHLKILTGSDPSQFYVLDLHQRQAAPMVARASGAPTLAPDGQRAWVWGAGQTGFAGVRFSDLHATNLVLERSVHGLYDVAQATTNRKGIPDRALIAVHRDGGALGATVLDALEPDTARTRFYGALLLGGLQ